MSALISSLAVNVFDHSQRHGAVLSRRESVRPRQIRFFLSEETPPALSGPAHSLSRTPGACNKRSGTLRHFLRQPFFARTLYLTRRIFFRRHDNDRPPWFGAFAFPQPRHPRRNAPAPCGIFSSNRFFAPHSLPDAPHFSFGGMTTTALLGSAHSLSRNPDTRDETLRHLAEFSQATVFLPRILCLTRRIFLSAARHLRRSPTRPRRVYDSNFYINKRKRAFDRSGRLASRLLEPPLSSELSVRSFRTGHLNAETIRRPEKVYFPPFKTFFRQSIFCRHSLLLALYFFRIFPKVSAASSLLRQ